LNLFRESAPSSLSVGVHEQAADTAILFGYTEVIAKRSTEL